MHGSPPPARSQGRRTPTALSVLDAEGGRRSGCHRAEGAAAAPSCPRSPGAAGRLGFPLQSGAKRSQAGPLAQAAPVGWLVLIPLVCPRPRSGWQGTRLDGQGQRSSAPTWAPGRLHAAWAAEMQGQHLSAEDALASCPLPEPPWGTWQEPAPALPPASAATPRRSAGHTPRATAALPEAPCDSAASMPGHAARLGLGEGRSQELLNQRPPCVPACPCPPPPGQGCWGGGALLSGSSRGAVPACGGGAGKRLLSTSAALQGSRGRASGWGGLGAGAEDPSQVTLKGGTEAAAEGGTGARPGKCRISTRARHPLPPASNHRQKPGDRSRSGNSDGPWEPQWTALSSAAAAVSLRWGLCPSPCLAGCHHPGGWEGPAGGGASKRASSRPPRPPLPGPGTPRHSQTSLWFLEVPKHHLGGFKGDTCPLPPPPCFCLGPDL